MTRMWMVDPRKMCRKHLLGEHKEIHQLVGSLKKNKSIKGYIDKGLIETHNIEKRHEELVKEMKRRGYLHKSDLKIKNIKLFKAGKVDKKKSIQDLKKRCKECKF
ncbi:MAG: pyrimidine dimer DNA glycosylase/endonuclease V [Candidatus Pacearchaeota archaeon]